MEKTLGSAYKFKYDIDRVKLFAAVIPNLDGQKKEEVMEKAFDSASKIKDNQKMDVVPRIMLSNLRIYLYEPSLLVGKNFSKS